MEISMLCPSEVHLKTMIGFIEKAWIGWEAGVGGPNTAPRVHCGMLAQEVSFTHSTLTTLYQHLEKQ